MRILNKIPKLYKNNISVIFDIWIWQKQWETLKLVFNNDHYFAKYVVLRNDELIVQNNGFLNLKIKDD